MTRRILFALPQNTPTKSRIMAVVDSDDGGLEIQAVATVDGPGEAITLCSIINTIGGDIDHALNSFAEWQNIDEAVVKAVQTAHADFKPGRVMVPGVPYALSPPKPDGWHQMPSVKDLDWAKLFRETECNEDAACDGCGCPGFKEREAKGLTNECRPGGSCECRKEIEDDDDILDNCSCTMYDIGPRWAHAIYQSLVEHADGLMEEATTVYLYGTADIGNGSFAGIVYPSLLGDENHDFYMRLAESCISLAKRLQQGQWPIPQTRAEQVMLWWSAGDAVSDRTGGPVEKPVVDVEDLEHLPAHDGDFEMDALWLMDADDEANPKVNWSDFLGDGPVTVDEDSFFELLTGAEREREEYRSRALA